MNESLLFWSIAAVLITLAAAFVLRPLSQPPRAGSPSAAGVNADVLRGQLDEIARDATIGLLLPQDVAKAREELQRRTLAEASEQSPKPRALPRWIGPILVVAILPPVAILSYLALGSPAAIRAPALMATAAQDDFMARLQRHLREQPRDGRGWVLLARGHAQRQQFAEAATAYTRALSVSAKVAADAGVLCEYADAIGMTQGGSLSGKPAELIARALALDPRHPVALEMAGSAAYEQRRYREAANHWSELLAQLSGTSERHEQLTLAIDRARRKAAVSLPNG